MDTIIPETIATYVEAAGDSGGQFSASVVLILLVLLIVSVILNIILGCFLARKHK